MPFVYDPNLDDEEKQKDASQTQISGAAPSPDSGGTTGKSKAPENLNTGSGFQNLDKYLQTNQSQQFGQQVAGKVQGQINNARQNIDQASQNFTQKVQGANSLPNQDQLNSALANPEQADAKSFQNWMKQSYQGPNSLGEDQSDYGKFWSGTNQANTQAKLLGTEPGRFSLLDSYFGRPTYNYGQKSLDNMLIQRGNIGNQTQDLQNQAAQLKTYGNNQSKELQNKAATRAGEVEQNRNQVNQAFNTAQSGVQNQIADQLSQQQQARSTAQKSVREGLSQGQLTADEMAKLGLTAGQDYYNLDLNSFLNQGGDLTKEQVATDEQRARLNALASLAGISQDYLGGKDAASDAYTFEKDRFTRSLADQKARYDLAQNDVSDTYNQALGTASAHQWNSFSNMDKNQSLSDKIAFLQNQIPNWTRYAGNFEGNKATDEQKNDYTRAAQIAQDAINKYNAMMQKYQPNKRITSR